jgi:hypothetical protein
MDLGSVPGGALRDASLVAFVARSRLPLTGEYAMYELPRFYAMWRAAALPVSCVRWLTLRYLPTQRVSGCERLPGHHLRVPGAQRQTCVLGAAESFAGVALTLARIALRRGAQESIVRACRSLRRLCLITGAIGALRPMRFAFRNRSDTHLRPYPPFCAPQLRSARSTPPVWRRWRLLAAPPSRQSRRRHHLCCSQSPGSSAAAPTRARCWPRCAPHQPRARSLLLRCDTLRLGLSLPMHHLMTHTASSLYSGP